MGEYIDLMGALHSVTERDYLSRVNDKSYPKPKASSLARKFDFDYWDGDRRINYGGYRFIPGRFSAVADRFVERYSLDSGMRVLDIGCGKGFQLAEIKMRHPALELHGIDISSYAVRNSHESVRENIVLGSAEDLPFPDDYFDFVFSLNTLHNLTNPQLEKALKEITRVAKGGRSYICVESFRNIQEFVNLLYWQVTCEQFCSPDEWSWWFDKTNYDGDYSFIYFE